MRFCPSLRPAVLAGALMLAASCSGGPTPAPPADPVFRPIDPSQLPVAPGVPGVNRYWGILPCADCAGIRTDLTLTEDPRTGEPRGYELVETYLGSMSADHKPVTTRGAWSLVRGTPDDGAITVIRLDGGGNAEGARSFEKLNDHEIRLLDREQRRITSDMPYSLTRVADAVLTLPAPQTGADRPSSGGGGPAGELPAAMVTDLVSGWPVTLRVGQEMLVRLATDRAAGGRWSLRAGSEAAIVRPEGEPRLETSDAGGVEVFRLKALKTGATILTFDYKKGSDGAAVRSVSYPVTVP